MTRLLSQLDQLAEDGFALVPAVYSAAECRQIAADLQAALENCTDSSAALRRHNGSLYGVRNLTALFPAATQLWQRSPLIELLSAALGPFSGLVRGLFFDK